jgi:hypothetical protein
MPTRSVDRLIEFAETAMFEAELVDPAERETLLIGAKDALIKVEMVAPGRGAWLLACVNARLGNAGLVQKWLERARTSDSLPCGQRVASNAYMIDMRAHPWFQELVSRLA